MQTVAIVEDNKAIREAVTAYLKLDDFNVVGFESCSGVVDYMRNNTVDLTLMDITLPDGDGFLLVKEIRGFSDMPIIFLTSRAEESDRILGFELGGDDYVQKPFSHKELILRIKAVLRRRGGGALEESADDFQCWQSGDSIIQLDIPGHKFMLDGESVKFTSTEWKIITYLISNAHVVLSREQILDHSLEYSFEGYDRIVDTHIKNIRAKLGNEEWIETVRGYGYSFSGSSCS
ncbi:MAG: response regulator transcription factor [Spirochaetales bacterium]|uniref:Response regulator transcription factor n=1 Tax=Candidatus Thalassospirochaeta sargassi TaxID=3119039 RepID=A0AAJ1IIE6_9SPIO|nr:response regulator transcription factor [Spirochaetales bacterium]